MESTDVAVIDLQPGTPIRIDGQVIYVKDKNTFTVFTPKTKKKFIVIYKGFCPIRVGDAIRAVCQVIDPHSVEIIQPPLVKVPHNKEAVVSFLSRNKFAPIANLLYSRLEKLAEDNVYEEANTVDEVLSAISERWRKFKDPVILTPITMVLDTLPKRPGDMPSSKLADDFITAWHRSYNMRKLYLLGLNKVTIEACKIPLKKLYDNLMRNPYTVAAVPI